MVCAILTSKVPSAQNCLKEIDDAVVGFFTGAGPEDAPAIDAMSRAQCVFLRAGLGV